MRSRFIPTKLGIREGFTATLLVLIATTFVFATQRAITKAPLFEATAWGALVLISFGGWGFVLARALFPRRRVDAGLATIWGASAVLFVGGVLASISAYSRTVALVLVDAGILAATVEIVRRRADLYRAVRSLVVVGRRNALLFVPMGLVFIAVAVWYFGSAADPSTNPYDDDIAYLAFVKKLLQTGTLIEPYSLRRLSAYGGHTVFLTLLAPHATYLQLNLFDRGIGTVLFVALFLGHRDGARRVPLALSALTLGAFLTLSNTSINTAPHYLGVAFFVGVFRTLAFVREDEPPIRKAIVLGLVATAACTLRQNYLVVPVVMFAASYGGRLAAAKGQPWRERLLEPALTCAAATLFLAPWFLLSYRSNATPLYPALLGTARKALELKSENMTLLKEARLLTGVLLEFEPLAAVPVLILAGALVPERLAYRPLRSLWIASAVGLVLLAHAFSLADAGNISRYLFGFVGALVASVVLVAGTARPRGADRSRVVWALGLATIALCAQSANVRSRIVRQYGTMLGNIDTQRRAPPQTEAALPNDAFLYHHVQSSVPAGETIAVMVDAPYHLDFARNPILNIDMPGYASPKPGMPFFRGARELAAYFQGQHVRFLMYVRPEHSQALYQREFWFLRLFSDEEIWRVVAPYFLDFIDNLAELRQTTKVVTEEAGIVVLDLDAPR